MLHRPAPRSMIVIPMQYVYSNAFIFTYRGWYRPRAR